MYTIRSLAAPQRLEIAISGAAGELELLRLLSQASAMAEADGSQYVCCDITGIGEIPADPYVIAAALAAVRAPILRVAVIALPNADELARGLARMSGRGHAMRIFRTHERAMAWLKHSADAAARSSTALRHASEADSGHRREGRGGHLRSVDRGFTAA